ncbi:MULTISPECIES: type II toxin-antitoxin system ParD family antitoxin [Bromeliae group (in: Brasilonema)]|jgi:antitoxin ParD1/3/4|uniref:Type II toxin-antitoxin system ParD family antitoxin n=2 Tax=Bromeliae group (in: Brasilonema) TaxID=3398495 RepID=A0A856M9U9_9CYAN|nr:MULTISPECIES: type II toxin-antitoxin system ParD family antitoxin [Brasilonema]NMG18142.1 type II toxin-antitoxin system ParD family antitoxin [Brasilonema bromeliae SPC951]QDL07943.1 type II toxin-antitoxin system ParD family antitoxin [Brasilonema sennae CENA114]QDL14303.1 type II toxin-antitoxin system ParD family antitoxin [Brasilonema octagenarum UFV-E1]
MNISLKPEHEQFIQSQIQAGRYANAEDVMNEALKLMQAREQRLEELRQKIAVGKEQIARGEVTDGEIVFAQLQDKINKIAESQR